MKKIIAISVCLCMLLCSSCGKVASAVTKVVRNRINGNEAVEETEKTTEAETVEITTKDAETEVEITIGVEVETEEETAEETTEEITVEETTEAEKKRDVKAIAPYGTVYMSDAGTTLIVRSNGTCIYTEVNSDALSDFFEGTWKMDEKRLLVDVTTKSHYELFSDVDSDDRIYLQCSNGQPWSNEWLYQKKDDEKSFLPQYLKDGYYSSYDTATAYAEGELFAAFIDNGFVYIYGSLSYLADSQENYIELPYLELKMPLDYNYTVESTGGDNYELVDDQYFNNIFYFSEATGLGFGMQVQDGKVIVLSVNS